jgi:hypothetical protein
MAAVANDVTDLFKRPSTLLSALKEPKRISGPPSWIDHQYDKVKTSLPALVTQLFTMDAMVMTRRAFTLTSRTSNRIQQEECDKSRSCGELSTVLDAGDSTENGARNAIQNVIIL